MRFAISIPDIIPDGQFDPDDMRAFLTRAEELGYESAWTQEMVFGHVGRLAPLDLLTFAAACNSNLRLGCAVFLSTFHSPVHLAKSLTTLDQLSRGRLEVGVATGATKGRQMAAYGVRPGEVGRRFEEGIKLMKALWTQSTVNFDGEFFQVEGAAFEPKPFQKPTPPLWFGGHGPKALNRAVTLGDGFFGAGSQTTEAFATQVRAVRNALAVAGRDPHTFKLAKRVYIAIDDNTDKARARITQTFEELGRYSGGKMPDLTPVAVYGNADACETGLRDIAAAGAELILLTPLFDEVEQMERLGTEVVSRFS
ncbi:TIGR03619 family F420-dependent LLM class oxidoreductase [Streptomyces sp. NPDC026672]|uniref:LLM class flavin-dependent oxidoreductase n=1 Tax=unclassified Streptomyces TaxID=2593676 RepID=UPI0034043760